ncbi:MAG: rhodanese-like domain-containing protein [Bdellovibrionaceae bacterium]|nr:rhodanese-like domain-containing protein [Pseudobdellovibrionaceae bacterium]
MRAYYYLLFITLFSWSSLVVAQDDVIVLDVRTPVEYKSGHLEKSINLDFYAEDFEERIKKLDKNNRYLLYCRSGNRSSQVERKMKELGFKKVENLGSLSQALSKTGYRLQY